MIAYSAFLLFFTGILCCIRAGSKVDKFVSLASVGVLLVVFKLFFDGMLSGQEDVFSFVWNSSPGGDINVDIISNKYGYEQVFPFFVATILAVVINFFLRLEKRSSSYNAILLFNLVAIILMLTSNNFVQLLAALFVTDILATMVIKNTQAGRRYVLLNIFADMLLFMVIAVINSRIRSLDIRQILRYNQIGIYPDFVTICGLTVIFIRAGFFAFHIGIASLKEIRLYGLLNVLFLFSPLSALILLLKFHIVWQNSAYFIPYFDIMCILTALWGFWRSVAVNEYKSKLIYLQMIFMPLIMELLRFAGFVWNPYFTSLFLGLYIISQSLYLIYYYSGRRKTILQLRQMKKINKTGIFSSLLLIFAAMFLLTDVLYKMCNAANHLYIFGFYGMFMVSLGLICKQIYCRSDIFKTQRIQVRFNFLPFVILMAVMFIPLRQALFTSPSVYGTMVFFAICCFTLPLVIPYSLYKSEKLQAWDGFGSLYEGFTQSARLFGRSLTVLIDRLLIEKIILKIIISLTQFNIRVFRKINNSIVSGIFVILLLVLLLRLSFQQWGIE